MATRVSDAQIFDATVLSIRTHGVHGSTTREIARLAGINEVTLFRRFGDKRQLIRAAVHEAITRLGAGEFARTDDVRADLTEIVRYYAAAFDPRQGIALTLLGEAGRHPDLRDLLSEPIAVLGHAEQVLRHHQRRGTLVTEPVREALHALVGPLLIAALSSRLDPAPSDTATDDDQGLRALVERFLSGHRAPSPAPLPSAVHAG